MTVRFKCQSEYQKSYGVPRSRSVSPQRCAPLAGLRSDHMGISREPALQRRKRLGPARSCSSLMCLPEDHYPVAEPAVHRKAPPAASRSRSAHKRESKPATAAVVNPAPPAEPETPPAPRPAADPEPPTKQPEQPVTSAKAVSQSQPSQPVTSAPDGQQRAPGEVKHALRRRAGLRSGGQRAAGQMSEYHRQFSWKKPVMVASPILTAEQVLYSSSRSVPPFKKNPVPMETEYRRSFLGQAPPTGTSLRKHLELQRVPLFHTHKINRRRREESENKPRPQQAEPQREEKEPSPLRATPPPPRVQRGHRIPEGGGATDRHAHQERRQKAMSYRHRAWGANFSRHHLGQLQSEHNALWEPADTTDTDPTTPRLASDLSPEPHSRSPSCVEALDLNSNSSRRSSAVGSTRHTNKKTQTDNPGPPAERRSAWEEEEEAEEEEEDTEDEEGRLPTPRLKMRPVQRTHHDLTTPAAGGAILVGKPQSSDDPSPHKQQRCGSAVSTATGVRPAAYTSIKPKEAWSEISPASSSVHKDSPFSKANGAKQTPPSPAAPRPPAPPPHCIQGTLRHPDFQHNGELGLRFRELPCPGGGCTPDEDDRLSVMSWRSAASCSMASAVLERAQKRRDNFWGKR